MPYAPIRATWSLPVPVGRWQLPQRPVELQTTETGKPRASLHGDDPCPVEAQSCMASARVTATDAVLPPVRIPAAHASSGPKPSSRADCSCHDHFARTFFSCLPGRNRSAASASVLCTSPHVGASLRTSSSSRISLLTVNSCDQIQRCALLTLSSASDYLDLRSDPLPLHVRPAP